MQEAYGRRGFSVLGFPCNQFGAQEPGSNEQILVFAQSRYDVNFPMFAKVEVNGPDACDLYQWLKEQRRGASGKADIAWNFTKFLIDGNGEVAHRYEPQVPPEDLEADIRAALARSGGSGRPTGSTS